jgi:hypothetical protein
MMAYGTGTIFGELSPAQVKIDEFYLATAAYLISHPQ